MTIEETIKQHVTDICEKSGADRPITIPQVFHILCKNLGEDKAIELFNAAVIETKHKPFRWTAYQATLDVYAKNKLT